MQISFDRAVGAFIDFMAEQTPKITDNWVKWLSIGGLAVAKQDPSKLKKAMQPWLEMAGVLDNGMVDIDMLKVALDEAFNAVPEIGYLNFRFHNDDGRSLVAKLRGVASSEPQSGMEVA